jgi:hypothetical protein
MRCHVKAAQSRYDIGSAAVLSATSHCHTQPLSLPWPIFPSLVLLQITKGTRAEIRSVKGSNAHVMWP